MSERDYVAAADLTAFLAEKDAVCGEVQTLPSGRVVTCTKPRGHLAHSAPPGCVWEHPGYTRARSERDMLMAKLRRVRALTDDMTEAVADDERTLRLPDVSVGEAQTLPAMIHLRHEWIGLLRTILEGSVANE